MLGCKACHTDQECLQLLYEQLGSRCAPAEPTNILCAYHFALSSLNSVHAKPISLPQHIADAPRQQSHTTMFQQVARFKHYSDNHHMLKPQTCFKSRNSRSMVCWLQILQALDEGLVDAALRTHEAHNALSDAIRAEVSPSDQSVCAAALCTAALKHLEHDSTARSACPACKTGVGSLPVVLQLPEHF